MRQLGLLQSVVSFSLKNAEEKFEQEYGMGEHINVIKVLDGYENVDHRKH